MDELKGQLLQDYINTQREATKVQIELKTELQALNRTLSNGILGGLRRKMDRNFIAQVSIIVILVGIIAKLLWVVK